MDSTDSKRYFPLFFSFLTKFLLIHKAGNNSKCCLPCGFLSDSGTIKTPWEKIFPRGFCFITTKERKKFQYNTSTRTKTRCSDASGTIKTLGRKIPPRVFAFCLFPFFPNPILARRSPKHVKGLRYRSDELASLALDMLRPPCLINK